MKTTYNNLWDVAKVALRKFYSINIYIRIEERPIVVK